MKKQIDASGIVNILNNEHMSVGTGFFIDGKGTILTCRHVLEGDSAAGKNQVSIGRKVAIKFSDSKDIFSAEIKALFGNDDLALLDSEFGEKKAHYKLSPVVPDSSEKLKMYGFPGGNTDMIIGETRCLGAEGKNRWLQLADLLHAEKGFSGAPIFNGDGCVVGVLAQTAESNNMARVISSEFVLERLNEFAGLKPANDLKNYKGIGNYLGHIRQKTDSLEFKGIEMLSNMKGKNTTLSLYATLYIKRLTGISDKETTLEDSVANARGIVIKGSPGAGKSTFLKYYVRKELNRQTEENLSPADKILPFILQLEAFGKYLETSEEIKTKEQAAGLLVEYLLREYPQSGFSFTEQNLLARFEHGDCWLLFDGFDEVDSQNAKRKILILIDMLYEYWSNCKFVLTTRPYAMEPFNCLQDFQEEHIDALHEEQIEKYIKALALICNADEKTIDENGLINIIRHKAAIYELAKTPVMLTFICMFYFTEKEIPESRFDIIEKTIVWLIDAVYADIDDQELWLSKFEKIARYMFEYETNPQKEISGADLYSLNGGQGKKRDFISGLINTGILIRSASRDRYIFWHFCFEEFLTARMLCDEEVNNGGAADTIIKNWFNREWQEVIVLFSAALFREGEKKMAAFIDKVCDYLLGLSLEEAIRGTSVLGSILKELYPHTDFIRRSSKWPELKEKLRTIFERRPETMSVFDLSSAVTAYGLSSDERFADFDDTFMKIPSGTFYLGAQNQRHWGRKYDAKSTEFEMPVREVCIAEYEIRKYPITVEEYDAFIKVDGYAQSKEIWSEGGYDWRIKHNISQPRNWRSQIYLRNSPITGINWYEAIAYCNWLTSSRNDGYRYWLPTEAQWEHAYFESHPFPTVLPRSFNYYADARDIQFKTPVGIFPEAESHVIDMLGNVEELCADSWATSLEQYPEDGKAFDDPNEFGVVVRGGSTIRTLRLCRPTYRARCNKDTRYDTIGFRVVRALK